jgi:hypothetical protein
LQGSCIGRASLGANIELTLGHDESVYAAVLHHGGFKNQEMTSARNISSAGVDHGLAFGEIAPTSPLEARERRTSFQSAVGTGLDVASGRKLAWRALQVEERTVLGAVRLYQSRRFCSAWAAAWFDRFQPSRCRRPWSHEGWLANRSSLTCPN